MRPDRALSGTDLRITVGERVGTETHWETFDGRTADGDAVAVRSLCRTVPEDEYDRFESLATQWRNVSGRGSVRTLLDWGTDPEPWVAIECLPGELETLATGGSVEAALDCDLATRADLLADVCEAIRSYGRYGSTPYHLRIGPESVVFREDPNGPTAIVGDWGISGLVIDPPVTPYTAPEQLADGDHAGRQTDVYRLGALGYHLLSGSPPFDDADRPLAGAIRDGIGDDPTGVPESFRRVLSDSMALDPDDRQAGVYQFRRDLVDARPRVSPEERVVSGLPLLDGDDDEDDGDIDDTGGAEEPSGEDATDDEENIEDESERADDEGSFEEGRSADDGEESHAAETTADSNGENSSSTASSVKIGKYLLIGAVVLIVLIAGFFGASAFGLIGGGGGDDGGAAAASINGTVVDADGEPIGSDVEVTIERVADDNATESDGGMNTTTEGGSFAFENVSTGTYEISAESTDAFEYGAQEIEVDENGTDGVEVAPASATVNGAVVDAETGEPLSTDGDGEVDASIELVDGNGESVATATGGSYEFSVDDLDGSYTVTAEADGYESADHAVDSFGEQADIELEQRTLSLSGAVTDSNGDPLDGATVTLTTDAGQELTDTSVAGGDYAIEEVPIGIHDVEVTLDGYATATESVEFGEEDVTEDYELEAFGSIEGVVRDADDGSGLNGAELTLVDADGNEVDTVTSDSDGSYAFDSVAPGEYTIDAERGGTEDASVDVTAEPGATTERDVEMTVTG